MKCYHNGTIYPNEEEFFKAVEFFNSSQVNHQSLETLCREFVDNLKMNLIECRELEDRINNMKLRHLLDKSLFLILNESSVCGEINIDSKGDKLIERKGE